MQGACSSLSCHRMENMLPFQISMTVFKCHSFRTSYFPRLTLKYVKWSWEQGLCDNPQESEHQLLSCFFVTGTRFVKTATAGVWGGQAGKNIPGKILKQNKSPKIVMGMVQESGLVWFCFFFPADIFVHAAFCLVIWLTFLVLQGRHIA